MQILNLVRLPKHAKPWKYQLDGRHRYEIGKHFPDSSKSSKSSKFLGIRNGWITIESGYRWDGPSGPTIDTSSWMIASIVHDGLYQLMRDGGIPESLRSEADSLMMDILRREGMPWWRRSYTWAGVRLFGGRFAVGHRKG